MSDAYLAIQSWLFLLHCWHLADSRCNRAPALHVERGCDLLCQSLVMNLAWGKPNCIKAVCSTHARMVPLRASRHSIAYTGAYILVEEAWLSSCTWLFVLGCQILWTSGKRAAVTLSYINRLDEESSSKSSFPYLPPQGQLLLLLLSGCSTFLLLRTALSGSNPQSSRITTHLCYIYVIWSYKIPSFLPYFVIDV